MLTVPSEPGNIISSTEKRKGCFLYETLPYIISISAHKYFSTRTMLDTIIHAPLLLPCSQRSYLTLKALKNFKPWRPKGFFNLKSS